jgi:hypothetical protein
MMYGRYVSDTLSGVRAVRSRYLSSAALASPTLNHELLATVLTDRGGVFETPVLFFPLSPDRVHRTSVADGMRSLMTILRRRVLPSRAAGPRGIVRGTERSPA